MYFSSSSPNLILSSIPLIILSSCIFFVISSAKCISAYPEFQGTFLILILYVLPVSSFLTSTSLISSLQNLSQCSHGAFESHIVSWHFNPISSFVLSEVNSSFAARFIYNNSFVFSLHINIISCDSSISHPMFLTSIGIDISSLPVYIWNWFFPNFLAWISAMSAHL